MPKIINVADYIGKKYNKLTIISEAPKEKENRTCFKVQCDCGRIFNVLHKSLLDNNTKSCGCNRKGGTPGSFKPKHGMFGTPIYKRWGSMKRRCYSKIDIGYKNYGERGIQVCKEWQNFTGFYEWALNNGYESKLDLDRINNNGNYEPGNCRFISRSKNCLNKRNTLLINSTPASIICKENKIPASTFHNRLKRGWSIERSATEKQKP